MYIFEDMYKKTVGRMISGLSFSYFGRDQSFGQKIDRRVWFSTILVFAGKDMPRSRLKHVRPHSQEKSHKNIKRNPENRITHVQCYQTFMGPTLREGKRAAVPIRFEVSRYAIWYMLNAAMLGLLAQPIKML